MAASTTNKLQLLQRGISTRQTELQRLADVLAKSAHEIRRKGTIIRILLIILGSVVATQSAIEQLAIIPPKAITFLYLVLGITIAALAGIETAFKYESRGSELNNLAALCHSTVRLTDSTWYKNVGTKEDDAERELGALQLIELQDEKLSVVQERAALNGVNIALEIRKDRFESVSGDYDDSDDSDPDDDGEPHGDRPIRYAA